MPKEDKEKVIKDRASRWRKQAQRLVGYLIVLSLVGHVVWRFTQNHYAGFPRLSSWWPLQYEPLYSFLSQPTLRIVASGLALSAGLDLAYMLFTPGPDEAFAPLITGISATILLMLSDSGPFGLRKAAIVSILIIFAMALYVFSIEFHLVEKTKQEDAPPGHPK